MEEQTGMDVLNNFSSYSFQGKEERQLKFEVKVEAMDSWRDTSIPDALKNDLGINSHPIKVKEEVELQSEGLLPDDFYMEQHLAMCLAEIDHNSQEPLHFTNSHVEHLCDVVDEMQTTRTEGAISIFSATVQIKREPEDVLQQDVQTMGLLLPAEIYSGEHEGKAHLEKNNSTIALSSCVGIKCKLEDNPQKRVTSVPSFEENGSSENDDIGHRNEEQHTGERTKVTEAGHLQKRLSCANFDFLEMSEETAASFRELARLVEESSKRSFQPPDSYCSSPSSVATSGICTHALSSPDGSWEATAEGLEDTMYSAGNSKLVVFESNPKPLHQSNGKYTSSSFQRNLVKLEVEADWSLASTSPGKCVESRQQVIQTLKTFESIRKRCLEDPSVSPTDPKRPKHRRPDLLTGSMMKAEGLWINHRQRLIGNVPGVKVGDVFSYRMQLCLLGLHRMTQAGIAIVPSEHSPWGKIIAASVVMAVTGGRYGDDIDNGETVIYSGQGGLCKAKQDPEYHDQELKRGNLALANSCKYKSPIRLIRGHKNEYSRSGIVYSYDGLYEAKEMRYELGVQGKHRVFKFLLQRLPGQASIPPPPTSKEAAVRAQGVFSEEAGQEIAILSQFDSPGSDLDCNSPSLLTAISQASNPHDSLSERLEYTTIIERVRDDDGTVGSQ